MKQQVYVERKRRKSDCPWVNTNLSNEVLVLVEWLVLCTSGAILHRYTIGVRECRINNSNLCVIQKYNYLVMGTLDYFIKTINMILSYLLP